MKIKILFTDDTIQSYETINEIVIVPKYPNNPEVTAQETIHLLVPELEKGTKEHWQVKNYYIDLKRVRAIEFTEI
jgi:hypothetical protein